MSNETKAVGSLQIAKDNLVLPESLKVLGPLGQEMRGRAIAQSQLWKTCAVVTVDDRPGLEGQPGVR